MISFIFTRRDHPRSRGVYGDYGRITDVTPGSSPLARGLLSIGFSGTSSHRIIPARAGFTTRPHRPVTPSRDHPRSRGVYLERGFEGLPDGGSSPLARGLLHQGTVRVAQFRIIPARAGFTGRFRCCRNRRRDHPRSRGVYGGCRSRLYPCSWIIPARAGFTWKRVSCPVRPWDHPRSRGVYSMKYGLVMEMAGSSPLARGLHGPMAVTRMKARIIPARAGFTPAAESTCPSPRDHPRSRGVYGLETADQFIFQGSSPLARGLPRRSPSGTARRRIIPARAGFTIFRRCCPCFRWDHPRSRGVYDDAIPASYDGCGSSPLARGLRPRPFQRPEHRRIIPARAGFTALRGPREASRRDHPRSRGVYAYMPSLVLLISGSSPLARGLHLRILGIPTNPHSTRLLLPSLPT